MLATTPFLIKFMMPRRLMNQPILLSNTTIKKGTNDWTNLIYQESSVVQYRHSTAITVRRFLSNWGPTIKPKKRVCL